MAGGIFTNALTDLFLATSQTVLTSENFIRNETQPRNTLLWEIMRGHDMEEMIQGGDVITDQIILDEDSTYGAYNILEERQPRLSNHLTEISIPWAFTDASVTFSKHEKGLNMAGSLNRGARNMVFKKIIKAKWSNLFVSINKGMERELFAQPNNATMEAATPTGKRQPLSIFCTITEFGAVSTDAKPLGTLPPGFSTAQGVSHALWTNPVEFYADGLGEIDATAGARWDGFDAFMGMYDRLHFDELAIRPEYGEVERPEGFIITSLLGKKLVTHATAHSNDYLRHGPSNAAYPGLNFEGVPIKWKEAMDTANVWAGSSGTANAGETDATVDADGAATTNPDFEGPRYVWLVPKHFKKIMHKDYFMDEEAPPASPTNPYVRTVYFDCWHNNWNASRQRAGGVVTPSADIT